MKRMHRLLLALILASMSATASADITVDITGGAVGALPIAIVPFQGAAAPEDFAAIIRDDLHRSGLFNPLPSADFLALPASLDEVKFQNWRALGADNLVVGHIARNGSQYRIRFELLDVYGSSRVVGKRYEVERNGLRHLAHTISNQIFKALVGRPGGFNSRLAYVQLEGQGNNRRYRLSVAQADGHRPQTILTSREPLLSPAWSSDGKRLAYVSFEDRHSEIYVQNVATGKRRNVASFKGINGAPAWSPDGKRLAITLSRGGNPDIYLLNIANGRTRQFTQHWAIDTEPVWDPDGDSILFTSDRGGGPQIYRKSVSGGDAERLTWKGDYNASPDISPNGQLLAMVHRQNGEFRIAVKDLDADLTNVLSQGPLDESPVFSPNGVMLAYTRSAGGVLAIATISVHGRAESTLIEASADVREPAWSAK